MFRFVTWLDDTGTDRCERFSTEALLWAWLEKFRSERQAWPRNLCVYTAECIFDGS